MNPSAQSGCRCVAAILAGGEAKRLGGIDKGMAVLVGRPLIEWVIEALPESARHNLLIVANRNADFYARYGTVIGDATPGYCGPLAGVAAALKASTLPWLLSVPVDCPQPPAELLDVLWQQASRTRSTAVVARDAQRRQPLFALYSSSLANSATQAVSRGLGVAAWQDSIDVVEADFTASTAGWSNLNTPKDFHEFAEHFDSHE
jgi:molybdopterin-guanine dinucleotide biosynthesis protein A